MSNKDLKCKSHKVSGVKTSWWYERPKGISVVVNPVYTLACRPNHDTTIIIEVDIDHQSGWHTYRSVSLKAGESFTHNFPPEFSAHWIRFTSSSNCTATAMLEYK